MSDGVYLWFLLQNEITITAQQYVNLIQVAIAQGFHLFPFRTEKLSLVTPMVLRHSGRVGSRLFKPDPEQGSGFLFVRGLACSLPSCGWLSAAEPAKEGYVGLEVDILCLEVGVGIRFTARIRSGGAVYKRSQMPRITAPETEIL